MLEKVKAWWNSLPDKKVVVTVPVKWAVAGGAVVLLLTVALTGARRVEAQFVEAGVTQDQFSALSAKVEACVAKKKR